MVDRPYLAILAVALLGAVVVWGRSAARLQRARRRIEQANGYDSESAMLARAAFFKECHTVVVYGALVVIAVAEAVSADPRVDAVLLLLALPVAVSLRYGRDLLEHARLTESRSHLEQRAEEVLEQEELAPRRWAARLAPDQVPAMPGFEIGTLYRAGSGMMAGDFYDVVRTSPSRVAAVIGDVSGHGIDPSITAFQAKHLLRVFLDRFRDPAQALQELNQQLLSTRPEEFISLAVVLFDTQAGTLRYASAGHPAVFLWHDGEVRFLEATGPLLALMADADYSSREIPLDTGDLALLYTDGLAEARNGEHLFGEERIANHLRRDPGVDVDVLCKSLMEAAGDFAAAALTDDTAILAIRRV
ncbi:MAG TPA: PP2C family protein-serine/threonine phosphatase [Acidimicrobiales bacterium]|jgi:serine phosphatase RsbU (regulator of sigma subunit)